MPQANHYPGASRQRANVVVPFAGGAGELERLASVLDRLALGPDDTLTIVDNAGVDRRPTGASARVVTAHEVRSSYYARNRGADLGTAEWIVFLDADVVPVPDLLTRYLDPPPADEVAVLAGSVLDEPAPVGDHVPLAVRYSAYRGTLDHRNTLRGEWAYAQTANCAVRRAAFERVGGFRESLRSGGDADLCYRLGRAGWSMEVRQDARAVHLSRATLRGLLAQRFRHGSGAAWLDRTWPGSAPGHGNWPGLVKWTFQSSASSVGKLARGQRDEAEVALMDLLVLWAMELGRLTPNRVRVRK